MKAVEVEQQLIAVASDAKANPSVASARERRLFRDVLLHIANNGDGESVTLARATLRAWEIPFERCA